MADLRQSVSILKEIIALVRHYVSETKKQNKTNGKAWLLRLVVKSKILI